MSINNPRFPHTCKVYRISEESPFSDGEKEEVIYEGKCNKYGSTSLRTFTKSNVVKGDYAVDIPGLIRGVRSGYLVDVTDYGDTFNACVVTDCYASEMGTTIYFNMAKN